MKKAKSILPCSFSSPPKTPPHKKKEEEKTETAAGIVPSISIRKARTQTSILLPAFGRRGAGAERKGAHCGFDCRDLWDVLPAPVPRQMMCGPAFKSLEFLSFHQQLAFSGQTNPPLGISLHPMIIRSSA